jgi:hypothetical protein
VLLPSPGTDIKSIFDVSPAAASVAIAGIISPVVFGWLVDLTKSWNVPFATSIGILLIGAVIVTLWQPKTETPPQVRAAYSP